MCALVYTVNNTDYEIYLYLHDGWTMKYIYTYMMGESETASPSPGVVTLGEDSEDSESRTS